MPTQTKKRGYRTVTFDKSMAHRRPDLAQDFHPTKNGDMTPETITPAVNVNIWWKCHTCHHEWQAYGHTRNRKNGTGCPNCSNRALTDTYNLAAVHPEIAREFHPTKNGNAKPQDFMPGSGQRVWWLGDCGHEWETRINNRKGKGCPHCAGCLPAQDLNDHPHLLKELHPCESERTNFKSSEKCWWRCSTCGHDWQAVIGNRRHGSGCPVCAGAVATPKTCMAAVRPDLAAEFHPTKNSFTPHDILPATNKRIWWICSTCSTEWEAAGNSRTTGSGCPACASAGGYDQTKPGIFYVLAGGERYGKIGISNLSALDGRMAHHRCGKIFGEPILFIHFNDGSQTLKVETAVKRTLRAKYNIPERFDGHTEAFPAGNEDEIIATVWEEVVKVRTDTSATSSTDSTS